MAAHEIVEVIRRSEQGVTQPYLCADADGSLFFVKGRGAGYASLAKEWIAGSLAHAVGLPVPPFAILTVPKPLYDLGRDGMLRDLGHGPVFGSRMVDSANEISLTEIATVSDDLRRDIAAFDFWVMNGDRTLSADGGNPNILWSTSEEAIHVIDHNLAFDRTVTLPSLEAGHIFGASLSEIADDPNMQVAYSKRFEQCLLQWDEVCSAIPSRWNFADDRLTVSSGFVLADALMTLRRHESGQMWTRP